MDQNQRKTSSHPLGVMAPIAKRLLLLTLFSILLLNVNATDLTEGSCILNGHKFADRASWQVDCKNCTCLDRVPVCHEIQCKYEPCTNGKVFVLNEDQCCPSCEVSKNSCHYQQYLIEVIIKITLIFKKISIKYNNFLIHSITPSFLPNYVKSASARMA